MLGRSIFVAVSAMIKKGVPVTVVTKEQGANLVLKAAAVEI